MLTTRLERVWAQVGLVVWGLVGLALPFGLVTSTTLHWSTTLYVGCMMWAGPLGATFLLEAVKNTVSGLCRSVKILTGVSFTLTLVSAVLCLALTTSSYFGSYQVLAVVTTILQLMSGVTVWYFATSPRPSPLDSYMYL